MSSYEQGKSNVDSYTPMSSRPEMVSPDISLDLAKAYTDLSRISDELAGSSEAFLRARERFVHLSMQHRELIEVINKLRIRDVVE